VTASPSLVFAALADSTRRQIVDWMLGGVAATSTELASRLPISRQAVARHLAELRRAGLVVGEKRGREVRYRLRSGGLDPAMRWIEQRSARWDAALVRLAEHVADHPDTPRPG
jgi:DNA-binding transcriptional ArsR family regulator